MQQIKGFSKLTREQKVEYLKTAYNLGDDFEAVLESYRHPDKQAIFDDFSENTLTNYYLPFGVAPNFLIDGRLYAVPMVIEESSVVAAASRAASFWAKNGGFKTKIHDTLKTGDIWFEWNGDLAAIREFKAELSVFLKQAVKALTSSMEKRGGGISSIEILPLKGMEGLYRLHVRLKTADSMGANFINSTLEAMKEPLLSFFENKRYDAPVIIMAILSNYTPDCLVSCSVSCEVEALSPYAGGLSAKEFARRFKAAVDIAQNSTDRAVTHNKGIYNGVDAVVLATGNDFRAIEAAGHAYASRNDYYSSLSHCSLDKGVFTLSLTIPLALGTVGGLTRLHPMAAKALEILQHPSAPELMSIAASAGLANNFSAVASLVTTGIQKGHMKLHLSNILNLLDATDKQKEAAHRHFSNLTVSVQAVKEFIDSNAKL